jgi:hypothetical protein
MPACQPRYMPAGGLACVSVSTTRATELVNYSHPAICNAGDCSPVRRWSCQCLDMRASCGTRLRSSRHHIQRHFLRSAWPLPPSRSREKGAMPWTAPTGRLERGALGAVGRDQGKRGANCNRSRHVRILCCINKYPTRRTAWEPACRPPCKLVPPRAEHHSTTQPRDRSALTGAAIRRRRGFAAERHHPRGRGTG